MWDGISERLTGSIVALEPLVAGHRGALFAASQASGIFGWMPMAATISSGEGPAPSREQFDVWFDAALERARAQLEVPFATVRCSDTTVIGSTRYLGLRPEHRGLEIGWTWLSPSAWRSGANVEAKLLMLGHAFEGLGALRVEFKTDARNLRSRAALAALPAQFEGILRRHMIQPYGRRDSAYYSVIADEWPSVQNNLHRRLAAHAV